MEHATTCFHRSLASLECVEDHLWRSTGSRTLQELSGAFALLERANRFPGLALRRDEADRLTDHLDGAFHQAIEHLPPCFSRVEILRGFAAVRSLIAFAKLSPDDQQRRGTGGLQDDRSRVRIFRNALESARLEAEIAERAAADRQAVIDGLAALGIPFAIEAVPPSASAFG